MLPGSRIRDRPGSCSALIGSPSHIAHRAWDEARSSPARGGATNGRLLDLSSNGRLRVLAGRFGHLSRASRHRRRRRHVLAGVGGSSLARVSATSEEAHSLYLGTLAELGIVGLALLLVALAPPLVAAVRSRRSPIVPLTLGAYVCWLVHSGVDWDWTLVGVSGVGLLCGVGLIAKARDPEHRSDPCRSLGNGGGRCGVGARCARKRHGERAARRRQGRTRRRPGRPRRSTTRTVRVALPRGRSMRSSCKPSPLAHKGQSSEALDLYRRIVARDPNSWLAWTQLAAAATGAERRRAEAIALRLNPLPPGL